VTVDGGTGGAVDTVDTVERTCPRCGTDAGGAPWCPSCGLNLRVGRKAAPTAEEPGTAAPTPAPTPPVAPPQRRRPGNGLLLGALGGVLAVAVAAVAIVLATRGSGSHNPTPAAAATVFRTVSVAVAPTPPAGTTAPAPGGDEVTVADMARVLTDYAHAYSAEDIAELEILFAPDLVRKNGNDPLENHDAALETYRHQFELLSNPQYELRRLQYRTGIGQGEAFGAYRITHDAGSASGTIYFHFVSSQGTLHIDAIGIRPS
jgi:hypothetical protein